MKFLSLIHKPRGVMPHEILHLTFPYQKMAGWSYVKWFIDIFFLCVSAWFDLEEKFVKYELSFW